MVTMQSFLKRLNKSLIFTNFLLSSDAYHQKQACNGVRCKRAFLDIQEDLNSALWGRLFHWWWLQRGSCRWRRQSVDLAKMCSIRLDAKDRILKISDILYDWLVMKKLCVSYKSWPNNSRVWIIVQNIKLT